MHLAVLNFEFVVCRRWSDSRYFQATVPVFHDGLGAFRLTPRNMQADLWSDMTYIYQKNLFREHTQ